MWSGLMVGLAAGSDVWHVVPILYDQMYSAYSRACLYTLAVQQNSYAAVNILYVCHTVMLQQSWATY